MREIKFRAWVTRYDESFILYLKPNQTWRDIENGLVVAFTKDGEDYGYAEVMDEEINYPLMQYTGLKDKNGKEIYEGDIVQWETSRGEKEKWVVEWHDSDTGYKFMHQYPPGGIVKQEVIGNIYENPELLSNHP